jgi:hypothetical protein
MAFNIFGDAPQSLTGLLGEQATQDLQKKALTTGLINAAIGYIAQPKNQRYGSALPYIGRALMAGQEGAQGVYSGAIKDYDLQQRIEEAKRQKSAREAFDTASKNLYTTTPAQFQETQVSSGGYLPGVQQGDAPNFNVSSQYAQPTIERTMTAPARQQLNQEALQQLMLSGDPRATSYLTGLKTLREITSPQDSMIGKLEPQNFTPDSWAAFINAGGGVNATPLLRKSEQRDTSFIQNYEYAVGRGYKGSPEDWQKLGIVTQQSYLDPYRQAEEQRQNVETDYRFGRPGAPAPTGNVSVTAGGKTYYFPDQASANKFKKSAGVK